MRELQAAGKLQHKKKLILSGFHEAARAALGIRHHLFPQQSACACDTADAK
jgi:hypothetical protein